MSKFYPSEEAQLEDLNTADRMHMSVKELELLALLDQETPVSGDALAVYSK